MRGTLMAIRTPVSTSLNDFKQREAACLHVPLFSSSKQVMDIKVTKGLASVGNEELRDWTEKGWNQAMREGNYDRSREHLNFEIRPGGMVAPIDKSRPLTRRMQKTLPHVASKTPMKDWQSHVSEPW